MKKKIAVIFGISGQDGAYLADFLLNYCDDNFTKCVEKLR
jgi:GDP-D-mannose dehydratase